MRMFCGGEQNNDIKPKLPVISFTVPVHLKLSRVCYRSRARGSVICSLSHHGDRQGQIDEINYGLELVK